MTADGAAGYKSSVMSKSHVAAENAIIAAHEETTKSGLAFGSRAGRCWRAPSPVGWGTITPPSCPPDRPARPKSVKGTSLSSLPPPWSGPAEADLISEWFARTADPNRALAAGGQEA